MLNSSYGLCGRKATFEEEEAVGATCEPAWPSGKALGW